MLQWITTEEAVRGPREWLASTGDGGEYYICGPRLKGIPDTRIVTEYYVVSCGVPEGSGKLSVTSERIGEVPTLREAKAIAQRHHST